MKQHAWLSVIFVIGCATGGVASQLVIPPVHAQSSAPRWEYLCSEGGKVSSVEMTKLGTAGWELVSMMPSHQDRELPNDYQVDRLITCYKRPQA
jgi:hypothetical protein